MKKIIINLISAFFPTRELRKKIRTVLDERFSTVSGRNNKIVLTSADGEKQVRSIRKVKIKIKGCNNIIRIPKEHNLRGFIDIRTDNCLIDIQSCNKLNLRIHTVDQSGQKLIIGTGTTIHGAVIFLNEKDAAVTIGKNCLFSNSIVIWATDGHSVVEKSTGQILNHIKHPVTIEDNCWIGWGVIMTKNTHISSHSIVGGGSVVTREFEKGNVVIAGNPAKIIKTDVCWNEYTPACLEKTRSKENL